MNRAVLLTFVFLWLPLGGQAAFCAAQSPATVSGDEGEKPAGEEADEQPPPDRKIRAALLPPVWFGGSDDHRTRVGLGLSYLFDGQASLVNTSAETRISLHDLERGVTETQLIPGDPRLNNRKFDFEHEIYGPGLLVPLALPLLGRPKGFAVYPTLILEVAAAEVTFDFSDLSQPELSTSLEGDGVVLGAGLDLGLELCADCSWAAGWSYWYRDLSGAAVDRSSPVSAPFQEIVLDEVHLSRESHEIAARVAYVKRRGGWRYAPFLGAVYQRTDVEIEDELGLLNPEFRLETTIRSLSRFESDVTRALAGVDVHLDDRMFLRFESSFGGGDFGLRFQLVWKRLRGDPSDGNQLLCPEGKKPKRISAWLVPRVEKVQGDFLARRAALRSVPGPGGSKVYPREDVEALLDETEKDLLGALTCSEFAPLRDYVRDLFRRLREELETSSSTAVARAAPSSAVALAVLDSRGQAGWPRPRLVQGEGEVIEQDDAASVGDRIWSFLERLLGRARKKLLYFDEVSVTTSQATTAKVQFWAESDRAGTQKGPERTTFTAKTVWRGFYHYRVDPDREDQESFVCPDPSTESTEGCKHLDLWENTDPVIVCSLDDHNCAAK